MRITAGTVKNRRVRVPPSIRPTQDKVREALFSSLGEAVVGARVLDLFAGTGAVGLEAWSRGASQVTCVEESRPVFRVLRQNVERLCGGDVGNMACVLADVERYARRGPSPFDIIYADPPYDPKATGGQLGKALRLIRRHSMLAPEGVFVFEQGAQEPAVEQMGWRLVQRRDYGKTCLLYYGLHAVATEDDR